MTATLAVLLLLSPLLGQPGHLLTDEEVNAAIAAAKQPGWASLFVEAKGRFAAYYSVLLQGPVGRTMDVAREAFESYKPLAASDVPVGVTAREVTFTIIKHSGSQSIKNVVVMPPGARSRDAAIQPLRPRSMFSSSKSLTWHEGQPRTWTPRFGSEPASSSLYYRFAEDALPPGDLQIVVVTGSGEERYTVKAQDRDRLR